MTKLNDMKDAPRDGTEFLALYRDTSNKYWDIVNHKTCDFYDDYPWTAAGDREYKNSDLKGWLPLPPIPED
jgi:hypothetical protein